MNYNALGLLILRLGFGSIMAFIHGLPNILHFSENSKTFPDVLGIGSTPTIVLAIGAEFFCAVAIIIGIFTRIATVPLIITMGIAFFIFHANDPFVNKQLPLLFMIAFTALLATGPGAYSADAMLRRSK